MDNAWKTVLGVGAGIVALVLLTVMFRSPGNQLDQVPMSRFLADVNNDRVEEIVATSTVGPEPVPVKVKLSSGRVGRDPDHLTSMFKPSYEVLLPPGVLEDVVPQLVDNGATVDVSPRKRPSMLWSYMPMLLTVGILVFFVVLIRRGTSSVSSAAANAKDFTAANGPITGVPDVRFGDLGGIDEVVAEAAEIVEFLSDPERFRRVGAKIPSGFLLAGPPGTGKTMLAKAIAGEAGVPFFSVSGSEFTEMYVGVGASRVRDLFRKARAAGKAVIFIDEIDAVGRARSAGHAHGGSEEREQTLNQLLVEMDGFANSGKVFVLAATNRADILDPALLRPGRFDRRIELPLPDRAGRERILRLHARSRKLDPSVDLGAWAARCPGFSGAQLGALVNQAALVAGRRSGVEITDEDFEEAFSSEVLGPARRSLQRLERDRNVAAFHEAGHALVALLLQEAEPPEMISVVPRGPAGGATFFADSDLIGRTRSELKARLAVAMGGRAGEELLLNGEFTQGASGDYQQATGLATQMVAEWGMSPAGPGVFDRSSSKVRDHVQTLLDEALTTARTIVTEHEQVMRAFAQALTEVETMDKDMIVDFAGTHLGLGPDRWPDRN